jgi:hypothetical protein
MIDFLQHLFTPHHTNNHRAKILHHNFLSVLLVILLCLNVTVPYVQKEFPSVLGVSYSITTEDLVRLTNQKRAEKGLSPLKPSQELSKAAAAKASNMFQLDYWAHIAPDGTTPWYFIKSAGYEYEYAGENLARGFYTASDVVDAWMASPTHRENILNPNYEEIGFAVSTGTLTGTETVLVVQEFGSRYNAQQVAATNDASQDVGGAAPLSEQTTLPQQASQTSADTVAAAFNQPLVDSKTTTNNLALIVIGIFIGVFIIDILYIERKKLAGVISHNLDHIIFLIVILLSVIIIGKGVIL